MSQECINPKQAKLYGGLQKLMSCEALPQREIVMIIIDYSIIISYDCYL